MKKGGNKGRRAPGLVKKNGQAGKHSAHTLNSRLARLEGFAYQARVDHDVIKDGIAYITVELAGMREKCMEVENRLDSFMAALHRLDGRITLSQKPEQGA